VTLPAHRVAGLNQGRLALSSFPWCGVPLRLDVAGGLASYCPYPPRSCVLPAALALRVARASLRCEGWPGGRRGGGWWWGTPLGIFSKSILTGRRAGITLSVSTVLVPFEHPAAFRVVATDSVRVFLGDVPTADRFVEPL
jgi:hypothetical protein